MPARRRAGDIDLLRIETEACSVVVQMDHEAPHLLDDDLKRRRRAQRVVGRRDRIAGVEHLSRKIVNVVLVARLSVAAVDEHPERTDAGLCGIEQVEDFVSAGPISDVGGGVRMFGSDVFSQSLA